ncbi:hypothetical protein HUU62_13385 [Rhodoferax sp. 4810]|nr:hypothetical protein [Rhodoferax jenense]
MKMNKKMSANRTIKIKKMSARVPNLVYLKAKFIAESQGMTMEEKVTDLLKKDIQYVSCQKWFQEQIQAQDDSAQDFDLFSLPPNRKYSKSKDSSDGSEFDSNYVIVDDNEGE